ncbi:putative multidrug resistance ABC transporter ATP-binding/permease protein YheI [Paenibacillus solanacearum]|uniref:Multidrug resistance ABC transporter ATP-binding/permease protein YheI n=1 Tax=Paenibacillus solanacearum TaxID=2048548 RepID=A0A916K9I8_9BACL|nr:ABC transporter ATP-binding protein [Paenibacillus solanacearum]CAG7649078.1 putative multidrug resistance ABC transporter ATP-binding/permease protein YheI [Paenibacillus solanacearum]
MNGELPSAAGNRKAVTSYAKRQLLPYWLNFVLIAMKNIVGSLLYMVPPFMSKYILETVLPERSWSLLVIVSICMVAAPITGSLMIILEVHWGRFMEQLAGRGRAALYNGVQHQSWDWQSRQRAGDLMTRMLDDTRFISDKVNGQVGFTLFHIVTLVVGAAILLTLHGGLAAFVLLLWAGQTALMAVLGRHVKRRAEETAERNSRVAETVREIVSAAAFIKASGKETAALDTVRRGLRQEWEQTKRGIVLDHKVRLLNGTLNACFLVLMYTAGGWFVLQQSMTIGALVAFVAVYNWLRPFGMQLIELLLSIVKIIPSVNRVTDVAFAVNEEGRGIVPAEPVTLEADGLSFRYEARSVLRDIRFCVPSGSVVSVVGYRGSGKSTLVDLLLGLREPDAGHIRISGVPLGQVDRGWLRGHVLCVTQEVMLRSGTILDNIAFGLEASMEDVEAAVRIAQLSEWVAHLPDGIYTQVGERGYAVSGGERQRISIARALLRRPSVLLLDEATSALDQRTERRLLEGLLAERNDMIVIFITHRLDVARRSDLVLVLDEGLIAQRGAHDELLAQPGLYRELWTAQAARR